MHGFVTTCLRAFGVKVTTLDINEAYEPDFVGSVLKMPFSDNAFTMSLICEVLEHLPYDSFSPALKELRRVTERTVLLSLPDVRRTLLSVDVKLPFLKRIRGIVKAPTFKRHIFDGQHHFEIGKRGYSPRRIRQKIIRAGFVIRKDKVYPDTPKNHYFVLDNRA